MVILPHAIIMSTCSSLIICEVLPSPVLEKLREHLASKNVACEIAQQLCDSIETSLVGKSYSTFTGLTATVKQALNEALTKVKQAPSGSASLRIHLP